MLESCALSLHDALPILTVTVCGAFQSATVKVSVDALTVPSVASLEATGMTTSAVGWLFRTTENVALPPASLVRSAEHTSALQSLRQLACRLLAESEEPI